MMRWIAGLTAVLLLPACGGGSNHGKPDSTGTPDLAGAGQLPTVRIISPDTGTSVSERSTVTIEAEVTDPDAAVVRVDFYDDNRRIGGTSDPPYVLSYGPLKGGTHLLCAVAVDMEGNLIVASPAVTLFAVKGDDDKKDRGRRGH
jgi:hypothetical protein